MTPAQRQLYIRTALAAYRAGPTEESFSEFRHRLVAEALGEFKRFREFSNRDLDIVLAHFRAHARPVDLAAALEEVTAEQQGRQRRLRAARWQAIERLGELLRPLESRAFQREAALRYLFAAMCHKLNCPRPQPHEPLPKWFPDELDEALTRQLILTATRATYARQRRQTTCKH